MSRHILSLSHEPLTAVNLEANESVFGYLHLNTTDLNHDLGLKLPLGSPTLQWFG